jgi:hypothetical protein
MRQLQDLIASTNPDGLLLDIKLTRTAGTEGEPLAFDGMAVAQQLRSLQTRGELPAIPIVRLSQPEVVRDYIRGDSTSDDLFDDRISKDDLGADPKRFADILAGLALDYPEVRLFVTSEQDDADIARLLGLDGDFLERLDERMLVPLRRRGAPVHVIARFLIEKVIRRPGPLVDERVLSVRLGVDRQGSQHAWKLVLAALAPASYRGRFHTAYSRWWFAQVADWWGELPLSPSPLARLNAAERVAVLSSALEVEGLQPIGTSTDSPGTRYWHVCLASGIAVDPSQGFPLLPDSNQEPWQDPDYLSREAAMRDVRNPRLRESDRIRLMQERPQQRQPQ